MLTDVISVISLPFQAASYFFADEDEEDTMQPSSSSLDRLSLRLLLRLLIMPPILSPDFPHGAEDELVLAFRAVHDLEDPSPSRSKISFDALYSTLCEQSDMMDEDEILLFYHLVEGNLNFFSYIQSRANDSDKLMLSFLCNLYHTAISDIKHGRIQLATLVMLTNDSDFCKQMQTGIIEHIPWFEVPRQLRNVTLSDLIILVLLHVGMKNLGSTSDEFFHTACFATLANMSAYFSDMHSYAAQRLVSAFALVTRQFLSVVDDTPGNKSYGKPGTTAFELACIVETLLAIINSCLANRLRYNPNLIYSVLVQKDSFHALEDHPKFASVLENINILVSHFERRLEKLSTADTLSVDKVLSVIRVGATALPDSTLKKLPPLKFAFIECEEPDKVFQR